MTAAKIFDEIKRLHRADQLDVIKFVYRLDAQRELSGPELSALAKRMADAPDHEEAGRIREQIERGFYGVSRDA
jgi:hypothetical protein